MPPKIELVREWFDLAQKDANAARVLIAHDPPLLEGGCFHCQQAIEKALKAVLLLNDQRPPRTHSLSDLIGLCERWVPGLSDYDAKCDWLSACAVDIRYPESRLSLTGELAREALSTTEEMLRLILSKVSPEVRP